MTNKLANKHASDLIVNKTYCRLSQRSRLRYKIAKTLLPTACLKLSQFVKRLHFYHGGRESNARFDPHFSVTSTSSPTFSTGNEPKQLMMNWRWEDKKRCRLFARLTLYNACNEHPSFRLWRHYVRHK